MLTRHQRHHVEVLLKDAADLRRGTDRNRVRRIAQDMLDGTADWPDSRLDPVEIHDYIEKIEERSYWDTELARR